MRGIERVKNVFGFHVESIGVIQPAVPGLGDQRQTPPIPGGVGCAVFDSPRDHRVARNADAVRVRDDDRSLEKPAFFNPIRPGHLAVAV